VSPSDDGSEAAQGKADNAQSLAKRVVRLAGLPLSLSRFQ